MKRLLMLLVLFLSPLLPASSSDRLVVTHYTRNTPFLSTWPGFVETVMVQIAPDQDTAVVGYKVALIYNDSAGKAQAQTTVVQPQANGYAFAWFHPGDGATRLIVSVSPLRAAEALEWRQ